MTQIAFAQEHLSVNAATKKVLLFHDRAQISTDFDLKIPSGLSQIEVFGLANSVDQNTIGVKGKGNFTLLSVDFEQDYISKKKKVLEDSIQMIGKQIDEIELQIMALEQQSNMIMSNANIRPNDAAFSKKYLEENSEFFRNKVLEIGKERLSFKRESNALYEKRDRLNRQLETDASLKQPLGKLILRVKANAATQAHFDLNYIALNTGWVPYYDIRVANLDSPMNIGLKARVYQHTGVDWEHVNLTLSTASVNRNNTKPELYPQYLSFYEPRPVMYQAKTLRKSDDMSMAAPAMAEMADAETLGNYVQNVEGQLNREYRIDMPYDVASGKDEHVDIQNLELAADYSTYIVPSRDRNGFLLAEIEDWSKHALLNAQANVYFEGAFVGKSYIQTQAKDEPLKVSLGRDERIIAEREEIDNFKSRKVLGSSIRERFGYVIKVNNTQKEKVKVWIEDQVPVSQDSAIEVTIEELNGGEMNKQTGVVKWSLDVPAATTKQIEFKYEVKYPKDKHVSNL
ncbi:DUF4139 domain-containing protein [Marinilongibacter aquaticus]|uniref:DUF4139 domain-containing protein n=1 Tax=Marinilongibacter aquaticus TaxID=2975157 RepID=UPI0021BD72BA|nr:DUF4139 domain-containing protein [Marinilongibacter aquaticus]UBM58439.1 DUF4139 domain-containing protein [Marinilongibacter aquaticus]